MKIPAILAIATIMFASCSKNYTCECVTPETGKKNEMQYKTNKKTHATSLCKDWQGRQRSAVATEGNVECTIK